jgi:hypothetical protein
MKGSKNRSLGELEALYRQKIKHYGDQRAALVGQLRRCDEQLKTYEEKLRWVKNLIASPEGALPSPPRRRRRKAPVKEVTYLVLKNRPGQWLTAAQVRTAIRNDTSKRVSRQSVNVNLNLLEKAGQVRRRPAPKGSGGARYVFQAV